MVYAPIICLGRSGTTLLFDLLCSHPDVGGIREIFAGHRKIYNGLSGEELKNRMMHQIKAQAEANENCSCFTTTYFYEHTLERVDDFFKQENAKIIKLTRNIIDVVLSHCLVQCSRRSNEYETHDESFRMPYKNTKISMSHETLEEAFEIFELNATKFSGRFEGLDIHEVSYKELVENRDKTCLEILRFLGLSEIKLTLSFERPNPLVKQRMIPREKAITNYNELYNKFKNTEYEKHFKEPNV